MSAASDPVPRAYRVALGVVLAPIVRRWGRLEVSGLEHLPATGPVLLAGNHDSYWDPVAIGIAALPRRPIRALAKSTLWKIKGLGRVLDGMAQIPVERGKGDAAAFDRAVQELRDGACIGVFPEGSTSKGRTLRARSGLGRLAAAVPEAQLVLVTVQGTTDVVRFPKRPHIRIRFFAPDGGQPRPDETPAELGARVVAELRALAPIDACGRRRKAARRMREHQLAAEETAA
jgi:1-acyl-sn-glycerol-3-phosphate acyltransferase